MCRPFGVITKSLEKLYQIVLLLSIIKKLSRPGHEVASIKGGADIGGRKDGYATEKLGWGNYVVLERRNKQIDHDSLLCGIIPQYGAEFDADY